MKRRKQILYVEDLCSILIDAVSDLKKAFPKYEVTGADGAEDVKRCIRNHTISLDRLAFVCTDGRLMDGKGWEVVQELRQKGYTGPAVYTGGTPLPEEERYLYVASCRSKTGDELINTIKRYLG